MKGIPPLSTESDYPFSFPHTNILLQVETHEHHMPTEDLKCVLKVSGVCGESPEFKLIARCPEHKAVEKGNIM